MKIFEFAVPTKVYFGAGEVSKVEEHASSLGKKALLLAAKDTMRQLGFLDKVKGLLEKSGVEVVVSDDVSPNPRDVDIDRQAQLFLDEKCDFTVGLGGGSAMDTAKAVAFLAAQGGGTIRKYLAGGDNAGLENVKDAFPIMVITTTAGTGSEGTPWWVITNTENHEKPGTGNDSTVAKIAIVDPELMLTIPPSVTRGTGIDVLFHAMEAYIANIATPFTDLLAKEAIKLVLENLDTAINEGSNLEARSQMAWANTLAGIAIGEGTSGTVGIHAMGHSIGGQTDAPHGMTMASVALPYMRKTWSADTARYAEVTRMLGFGDESKSEAELAEYSAVALEKTLEKYGVNIKMRDLGVKEEMIEPMTDSVFKTMAGPLSCSLMELNREDIVALYKEAL
ncbi:MAG: iron-containing alcohol dehydrogenase [Spirochaetales bacterium]|nr:iron-containing alcohol dehydrogenase [Spirochaetales bacterium]